MVLKGSLRFLRVLMGFQGSQWFLRVLSGFQEFSVFFSGSLRFSRGSLRLSVVLSGSYWYSVVLKDSSFCSH